MKDFFLDDKNMVIIAVLVLGLAVLFIPEFSPEKESLMAAIISGLFGVAVGKSLK